ncbi:MAG: hypothetical protein HY318_19930 [Armatimonadetes bacterium]|nr:hypothetical protein [Armatimonadota bacterium]
MARFALCFMVVVSRVGMGANPLAAETTTALLWEAEDLARTANIIGGGDLLTIRAPDPRRLKLSSGSALTFAPIGKGAGIEMTLPIEKEGVYRLKVRGVMGPSCGIYSLYVGGEERGSINFYSPKTTHSNQNSTVANGILFKRMSLEKGDNLLRFELINAQGRAGDLVLDTLELVPEVRTPPQYAYDPYDKEIPAGERLGPNLVKDPGFEDFTENDRFTRQYELIKGWAFNSVVPKKRPCILRDKAIAHSGDISLLLTVDPLEDNTALYQQIAAESGKRYRVSFWAKGTGSLVIMFYQQAPAKGEDTARGYNTFKASDDWQFHSFIFEPSRSAKLSSVGFALYAMMDSEIHYDDVSVQEVLP